MVRAVISGLQHATIGGLWSIGLVRRALLAAAPRLKLDDPDHVFLLTIAEIASALRSGDAPADSARERAVETSAAAAVTPPPLLGDGGLGGPPPGIVMPGALGRVLTAMFTYLEVMNGSARAIGIGREVVRGRAVVALDPEDAMDRIAQGDILVTTTTTPAFGAVLPMLAGIVAASGGPLSHTAIVARELGIPAIVGMSDALARIADGSTVELDAGGVEVRVV